MSGKHYTGRPLTLAYRGNFQPGMPAAERTSTEHQVAATLEAMGHRVYRLQENAVGWDVVGDVARRADLFLWTQTWNLDPAGGDRVLADLARRGVPTVSFHLDLYLGLARAHQVDDLPFWRTAWVFTADGGHDDEWKRKRINHRWMAPAIFEDEIRAGTPGAERAWPIIFVGSYPYPHPEHYAARRDIVLALQARYPGHFRVFRGGYRGQKLADLIAGASIVVGDSCLAGKVPRYWSDRIPETLGRAGFLIHPYVPGIEGSYTDGEHLRTYEAGDMRQMCTLIDWYLGHADDRRRIAAAGQAHVAATATYRHRMDELLATVCG